MTTETTQTTETMGFQTEAKRLLQLMIHSLYSNREIFLRELISNASDAIDKHRFAVINEPSLAAGVEEYRVHVSVDNENKTLTIDDNGNVGIFGDDLLNEMASAHDVAKGYDGSVF